MMQAETSGGQARSPSARLELPVLWERLQGEYDSHWNVVLSILRMSAHAVISSTGYRRIHRAQRWLENRGAAEEVLIVGATLDPANELARKVAKKKGAAFGWHRLALPQRASQVHG
jgi:hypothetical protein